MKRHDTKNTLGKAHYQVDGPHRWLTDIEGLVPLRVVIDPTVGEEVALFWRDSTPFVRELAAVRPFQFMLKCGLLRTEFGPIMWMLFYVPNPVPAAQPFASVESHLNPMEPKMVSLWRQLANQTHWHLTLLDKSNQVVDSFELDNAFGLESTLDVVETACRGMQVSDFMRAKEALWDRFSMDDLYSME